MLTFSFYLRYFFLAILLACGSIILTNLVVDPVNVYHLVEKEGFNAIKPKLTEYRIVWKLEHTSRYPAKAYFFGDSRTEMSVNPEQDRIKIPAKYDGEVFNFAVASSSIYAIKRYIQHLLQYQKPEIIAIGVQASQFSINQDESIGSFDKYFATDSEGHFRRSALFHRHMTTLMSSDIFRASLQTLAKQNPEYDKMSPYGHLYNEKTLANIFKKGTQALRFSLYENNFARGMKKQKTRDRDFEKGMKHFRDILEMTKENNIELVLLNDPVHIRLKLIQLQYNYQREINRWRRMLLSEIERSNRKYPDAPPARYMEFDLVNQYTTEPVSTDNNKPMKWFIDPIHGSENYGSLMLEATLDPEQDSPAYQQLTSNDLEQIEHIQQSKLKRFRNNHPELVAQLPD